MRTLRMPFIFVALTFVACSRNSQTNPLPTHEEYSVVEGSLGFDVGAGGESDGQFAASYTSQGKTAKFRIELGAPEAPEKTNFAFGKGRFVAEPGSEPEVFLSDLAKALEAKKVPKKSSRSADLPFEYAILGEKQSRSKDGGFTDSPSGNWTSLKLFFGPSG